MLISGFERALISRISNRSTCRVHLTTLYFVAIITFQVACKSSKSVSDPIFAGQDPDTVLVAIERGPCFGRCPEYKAMVTKKGAAYYTGKRNVAKPGLWFAALDADQLSALVTEVRRSDLEAKDTAYINRYLADFPDFDIWVSDRSPRKHIHINHEAPPEELTAFAKYFDALLNRLVWEPIDPQIERSDY